MPKKFKDKVDRELFRELFTTEKLSIGELAIKFGISPATATVIRKELGLTSQRAKSVAPKPLKAIEPESPSINLPAEETSEIKTGGSWVLYTDAATVGNFGDMGIGYVFFRNGNVEKIGKKKLKTQGTNNEAEYKAILSALTLVRAYNPDSVVVKSDSQLAINQINGENDIKASHLVELHKTALSLKNDLPCSCGFKWIPRDENKLADALASLAVGMPMAVINPDMTFDFWDTDSFPSNNRTENLPAAHPDCNETILRLNTSEKIKFADFTGLKTFGIDSYSQMGEAELQQCIEDRFSKETLEWAIKVLAGAEYSYRLSALKWMARGLNPDLALKKVSVDKELSAQNK